MASISRRPSNRARVGVARGVGREVGHLVRVFLEVVELVLVILEVGVRAELSHARERLTDDAAAAGRTTATGHLLRSEALSTACE